MKASSQILVTGGAGFIGSNLVDALLERGHRVRVLDNLATGRRSNLRDRPGLDFVAGDLVDATTVAAACAGVDTVFHLAAQVSVIDSLRDPARTEAVNVTATRALFATAAAAGVRRLVFSSSCAVYGDDPVLPKHEDLPPAPVSPYAASKCAAEVMAAEQNQRGGLSVVCLRYFNVYGPRQSPRSEYAAVVPRFLDLARRGEAPTIHGDGEQTRDFVYVGDVVRANLLAAGHGLEAGLPAIFNVGTGEPTSVATLWKLIAGLTGCTGAPRHTPARAGEVRHSHGDLTRTRTRLGFHAAMPLSEGLRSTLASLQTESNP